MIVAVENFKGKGKDRLATFKKKIYVKNTLQGVCTGGGEEGKKRKPHTL